MAPKQTDPQFKLRLTPELKDRIEAAATVAGRSMNAEILQRLEASFEKETGVNSRLREVVAGDDFEKMIERAMDAIQDSRFKREEERLSKILAEERKRTEEMLSRYVDMDLNSFGNMGDFAEAERAGMLTKSRLLTAEEAAELGIDINDGAVILTKMPKSKTDG